jgi:glycosyltransferase involved in cell wall biosynthesis
METVKVLRIITRLNIGGPAIHAILLSSELNKRGYRDMLVCGKASESEGDMGYIARGKEVDPIVIPELGRDISPLKDFKAFLKLLSLMRRERPDIVHTHMAKAGALGRLAALFAGVPIRVHTFHGHVFDGYFSPLKARVFLAIERMLSRFTDMVITVSGRVNDEIIDKLKVAKRTKSVIVPLGLEIDRFLRCEERRGELRKKIGVSDDTLLIGIVGRLVPIKNHKMFLDVARLVKNAALGVKVKFAIIGDGELRSHLETTVREMGLNDVVIFTGWMADLPMVYADLDIVCLTSLNEGTPVSIIEAMAAGKAVIATDVGGVRDLFDNGANGILVRDDDSREFFSALVSIIRDGEKKKAFGRNGREFVSKRYTKERLVKDIASLYSDLRARKLKR